MQRPLVILLLLFLSSAAAAVLAENSTSPETPNAPVVLANNEAEMIAGEGKAPSFFQKLLTRLSTIADQQRLIARSIKELTLANNKNSNAVVSAVKSLWRCPPPWSKFGAMCIFYSAAYKSWNAANMYCMEKGGYLLWLNNVGEHRLLNKFLEKNIKSGSTHAYIGLHRASDGGPLEWIGRPGISYRGTPLKDPQSKFFSANKGTTIIKGNYGYEDFLCRLF